MTPWEAEDANARLTTPKTTMAVLVRRLAEIAMSVTHHDASDTEPGYIHEVQSMERKFTAVLRGKLKTSERKFRNHAFQVVYDNFRANPPTRATTVLRTAYFHGFNHVKFGAKHPLIQYPKESQLGAAQFAGVDNARAAE